MISITSQQHWFISPLSLSGMGELRLCEQDRDYPRNAFCIGAGSGD